MKTEDCYCDERQMRLNAKKEVVEDIVIPDCYYTLDSGEKVEGSFSCRRPFPGECIHCYDQYVAQKMKDQFDPTSDSTLVWPPTQQLPKAPVPKDRWMYTEKSGWHVLKRPAAHAADDHITMCRITINPVGVVFSDDTPANKEDIACEKCKARIYQY